MPNPILIRSHRFAGVTGAAPLLLMVLGNASAVGLVVLVVIAVVAEPIPVADSGAFLIAAVVAGAALVTLAGSGNGEVGRAVVEMTLGIEVAAVAVIATGVAGVDSVPPSARLFSGNSRLEPDNNK